MSGRKTTGDYQVGYRKPPKPGQFKPGQSGNPKGRPKAAKSGPADIAKTLSEPLTVTKAGTTQTMSPFDVSVRQLVKRALSKNDLKAVLAFIGLCESYGIIAPMPPAEHGGGVLVVPPWDWNQWLQMFEQHGPPPWPGERSDLPDGRTMMANHKSKGSNRLSEPDDGPEASAGGYGNPPPHGRFKPGQSGNPHGRPRGAKGCKQTVAKIANEMHWVVDDGKRRSRSTLELVVLQLRNLAVQGNVQAFRAYHGLLARYSPQATETRHSYMIVPEVLTIDEWERLAVEVQTYQRRLEEEAEQQGNM